MEARVHEVASHVSSAISGMFFLARDLVGTEQGHRHLEKKIHEAGNVLEGVLKDIAQEAEKAFGGNSGDEGKNTRK